MSNIVSLASRHHKVNLSMKNRDHQKQSKTQRFTKVFYRCNKSTSRTFIYYCINSYFGNLSIFLLPCRSIDDKNEEKGH